MPTPAYTLEEETAFAVHPGTKQDLFYSQISSTLYLTGVQIQFGKPLNRSYTSLQVSNPIGRGGSLSRLLAKSPPHAGIGIYGSVS